MYLLLFSIPLRRELFVLSSVTENLLPKDYLKRCQLNSISPLVPGYAEGGLQLIKNIRYLW